MSTTFYTVAYGIFEQIRNNIFWTVHEPDQNGTIRLLIDGHNYRVRIERED